MRRDNFNSTMFPSITHGQQGQSVVASRAIAAATGNGSWVLLQNCHLGLDYMETMEDYVQVLWETNGVADKLYFACLPS